MQLVCNGVALDLKSGATLSFKKSNPLFVFDALSCERTQAFALPATPKNERVFELAKLPAFRGDGMRRRFACELQDGVIVKRGYLYVDKYNGSEYSAIFVTGELVGLQTIKNAGAVNNFVSYDESLEWNAQNIKPANAQNIEAFDLVRYASLVGGYVSEQTIAPSVQIKRIVEDAFAKLGETIEWPQNSIVDRLRIFNPRGLKVENADIRFTNVPDEFEAVKISSFLGITEYVNSAAYSYNVVAVPNPPYPVEWEYRNAFPSYQFKEPYLPYDCEVTFPDDFPDNMFLATGEIFGNHYLLPNTNEPWTNFLGGYSFDYAGNVSGLPLAGRTVAIPANTPFVLVPSDAMRYHEPQEVGETGYVYYDAEAIGAYDFALKISINHEFVHGDKTPYHAILPNVTILDLLKVVAAHTGTVLNYDGVLRFDALDVANWNVQSAGQVLEIADIKRTFSDFAQQNIVGYSSGGDVLIGERERIIYVVDNDNVDRENELQKLNVSEGGIYIDTVTIDDVPARIVCVATRENGEAQTIGLLGEVSEYMERAELLRVGGIDVLCDASTSITLRVHMTLTQYEGVSAKTSLLHAGTRYVWTEATWQNDVATIKLSKID